MKIDKLSPHSIEVEQSVLGALIVSPDSCKKVFHLLHKELFYIDKHIVVFDAIASLHNKDAPIDMVTVISELKSQGKLADIGGHYFVIELMETIASSANIEYWIRILWQLHIFREIIKISQDAEEKAYNQSVDVFELLEKTLIRFEKLDIEKKEIIIKKLSGELEQALAEISEDNKLFYLSGFEQFDKKLAFGPGNITLFGAASGVGKTKFITSYMKGLLENNDDISILWCNMEDSTPKMIRALVSCFVGLENNQLLQRGYKLSTRDKIEIDEAKKIIDKWDIEFIDRRMSTKDLKGMFKYFCEQRKGRFCVLVIDNVMKLKDHDQKFNQTTIDDAICNTIGDIMDTSKRITKSSILWVHHLNGEQQNKLNLKDGYRPRESHFKGSTRYCDTSTQIIMLNRIDKYPDLVNCYKIIKDAMKHLFITDIAKNRDADTGVIRWFVDIAINKFKEIK